ncbi:L,D-transpeptidase, partial [Rhodopseudomonas sp. B29]|uniref:L,D-transpeptidase n=1 Tax=Rhodopseudomonas sp. B29 TaxID=95607 RepID=UPI0003B4E622
ALTLGGCVTDSGTEFASAPPQSRVSAAAAARYAAIDTDRFPIAAVEAGDLNSAYVRQLVDYRTAEPPGTVVVDPRKRFLYLVMEGGKALRYGVGVGKAGLEFTGTAEVGRKAEWPHWTPTPNMIAREPARYGKWAKGMDGGAANPLGPRALYLYRNGKDTLFRIHGTTEPWTIGHAVSSGCIRMLNQDVIDLYGRVPKGAKVVVR